MSMSVSKDWCDQKNSFMHLKTFTHFKTFKEHKRGKKKKELLGAPLGHPSIVHSGSEHHVPKH